MYLPHQKPTALKLVPFLYGTLLSVEKVSHLSGQLCLVLPAVLDFVATLMGTLPLETASVEQLTFFPDIPRVSETSLLWMSWLH